MLWLVDYSLQESEREAWYIHGQKHRHLLVLSRLSGGMTSFLTACSTIVEDVRRVQSGFWQDNPDPGILLKVHQKSSEKYSRQLMCSYVTLQE